MKDDLISCLLVVYNNEKIIDKTLDDILAQDYEFLEFIIVNDASFDSSRKILEEKLKNSKTKNYKIIDNEKNVGLAESRNIGLDNSNGKYVWFCGVDDTIDPNFVSSLYENIILNEDVDISYCAASSIVLHNQKVTFNGMKEPFIRKGIDFLIEDLKEKTMLNPCNFWIQTMLIRRKLLIDNNLRFHKGCIAGEDFEFWRKMLCHAHNVIFTDKSYYTFNAKSNNNPNLKQKIYDSYKESIYRTIEYLKQYITNQELLDNLLRFIGK